MDGRQSDRLTLTSIADLAGPDGPSKVLPCLGLWSLIALPGTHQAGSDVTAGSIHLGAQLRLCYGTVAMTAWLLRASKVIMYASTGGPYSVLG